MAARSTHRRGVGWFEISPSLGGIDTLIADLRALASGAGGPAAVTGSGSGQPGLATNGNESLLCGLRKQHLLEPSPRRQQAGAGSALPKQRLNLGFV